MKTPRLASLVVAATAFLTLAACSDTPLADQLAGSYSCTTTAFTRYQTPSGPYRDTAYVFKNDAILTFTRIDDNTVSLAFSSERYGQGQFNAVTLQDMNYVINFSGNGTLNQYSASYPARLSGSLGIESKALAASADVQGYGGKMILSFTNSKSNYKP